MTINNFIFMLVLFLSFSLHVSACDFSIAHATNTWRDENNKEFSLADLEGKKIVMAMAYTSCQGTCPMIVSKLKKVEAKFKEQNIPVEVVVVTFDPKFDTPSVLTTNYREKMGIKNSNWHFLNGSESDTRKISMLLGVKYSRNPGSGMIIHDNKIILLDEHGAISKKLESLDEDEKNLLD